ncbi:hypothetical protein P0R33_06315 [Flavobacterium sp. YJ01]|uniref:DUF6965 family protein n=1 Tax=Flavobacterium sp. YJ01 TaxID=3031997 RepID=UPI0023E3FF76|nr:hypothetical protein [Flavobacterium sp. YJ01]WET03948.1 hypothetical protein P0R33_06315 [Flavobacterium sp. YJ01]
MNHEEIKRYFETNPPPLEVELTPWAKITNTQVFLKSCYTTIRNFNGPVDRCPAWWHLRDFYILMKKTAQQAAVEKIEETPFEEIPNQASSEPETAA